MDKRSLLGLILITAVIFGWMLYLSITTKDERPNQNTSSQIQKQTQNKTAPDTVNHNTKIIKIDNDSSKANNKYGSFGKYCIGKEETISIETELVKAKISTRGASLTEWNLKNYKSWNGHPTNLIWNQGGELFIQFTSLEGKLIDTRDLFFVIENHENSYKIKNNDSVTLVAKLFIDSSRYLQKKYTFFGNTYIVKTEIKLINLDSLIPQNGYSFIWSDGLRYQEKSSVDESNDAEAVFSEKGSLQTVNATGDEIKEEHSSSNVEWAAAKIKYFTVAIMPQNYKSSEEKVYITGKHQKIENEGVEERYNIEFAIPYTGGEDTHTYNVYLGPLDYSIVSKYNLEALINFGWRLVVRPIGEYFMLPIFNFIHRFIASNYGIAIIIFSLLMKILLYPLSIQQMRSTQKMSILNPEITKIREKFKDDQQQQQREVMKVYSEYGINPMGGCLPLVLQMPILYALWAVLRNSIDLRQSAFFWWINDLSMPDVIFNLPVSILGLKFLSGLALLMGITLFAQQKMTVTDPRQKAMVYMMPIMFTFLFANFPSGLNLYYFMFNLMGIAQQIYLNKFSKNKVTLAQLKKAPKKKEGWLQKKMREAQDLAESQGRSVPGSKYTSPKSATKSFKKKK